MCFVHKTHIHETITAAATLPSHCVCVCVCVSFGKSTVKTHFHSLSLYCQHFPSHFIYIIFASENMHRIESKVICCVGMVTHRIVNGRGVRTRPQTAATAKRASAELCMHADLKYTHQTILRIQSTRNVR